MTQTAEPLTDPVRRELWTSWASMLRVYSAAHGLTSTRHAVVEIGGDEIVLRVDTRWIRFTRDAVTSDDGSSQPFSMALNGRVSIGDLTDEMDMAAEQVARRMLLDPAQV